jgi:hypothetical protein
MLGKPLLSGAQLAPSSVERKAPRPAPAKISPQALMARAKILFAFLDCLSLLYF